MSAAVLVIAYARKSNVLNLLETVIDSGISNIFISIDGPRNSETDQIQKALIKELERRKKTFSGTINLWQKKSNMGSGASVIASIDWAFANLDELCILEDDLEIRSDFFKFMEFGLSGMKQNSNLKIVTGTNPFTADMNGQLGTLRYPVSWGWATNKENWILLRSLIFEGAKGKTTSSSLKNRNFWELGRYRALKGLIDAWDIPLACEMHKTEFFTLLPPVNLVRNIGFDSHALHTMTNIWPLNMDIFELPELDNPSITPYSKIELDSKFEKKIFKIKFRHIFSLYFSRWTNRKLAKASSSTLIEKIQLESYPWT